MEFISAQQMPWLESRTLCGKIGEYIAMMRETKEAYLVGVATNEEGRTLDLPMDFLEKGTEYEAVVVEDGDDAHYLHNREQLKVRRQQVSADSVVQVKLAPGGGCCLLIGKKI